MAAAAVLAALAAQGWREDACRRRIDELLADAEPGGWLTEYGGLDLGYLTVSMTYLAHMAEMGVGRAAELLDSTAKTVAAFVMPSGRLGGEFASRSTTYFLPFGVLAAAYRDPTIAAGLARLDIGGAYAKLDDRYLLHYAFPSLVMTALELTRRGVPALADDAGLAAPPPHGETGLYLARRGATAAVIALNKGGAFTVERESSVHLDSGYRLRRGSRVYGTCVLDEQPVADVRENGDTVRIRVVSGFHRYRQLTASPLKTIAIRLLAPFGPVLNEAFKTLLIRKPVVLPGSKLVREIEIAPSRIIVTDRAEGLGPGDLLYAAPPASLRLVPSARLYQPGEEAACLASLAPVALPRTQVIEF
jgi:hypothetical protein